ncbi:MAG: metallophosphoesterase family protein [Candidatus Hydrogenedentes bacterium]|nr:metallophosphoesterase family protein [Candidatus Hydrogenedentota bacterium]
MTIRKLKSLFVLFGLVSAAISAHAQNTIDSVMDAVVTRLYSEKNLDQLYALDEAQAEAFVTPAEKQVLATKHWYFDVDVPVVVSVMHNVEQKVLPFWLQESGFKKTDMIVKNMEGWTYEVWQKPFPAGRVELGINGFDNFRPHYFVCVGPQESGVKVTLSNFFPANQNVLEMKTGAMTYRDWTELVLTEVPESLVGQQLLPTIRGRGREAAIVGAFRKTPFPSSDTPAPVYLTWSDDPRTTQNIQWRTNTAVTDGVAKVRVKGSNADYTETKAASLTMDDRMLANDRVCHWFTAVVRGLAPDTTYEYIVGSPTHNTWSKPAEFTTAPQDPKPFTFMHCSDTHSHEDWGVLMKNTLDRNPDVDFCVISGDLVGTGLEREDWDQTLVYGEPVFRTRPVMPAIGNHDAQLGLGAGMYLDIFGLPENGPKGIKPEAAYTFRYGNAQFFVLDVMSETKPQAEWLRDVLSKSDAVWKIAIFHFPLYSNDETYPLLEKAWGSLFDEFHVDLVLSGHVHEHMRSYPMRAGKRVASPAEGTVYVTSVSIPSGPAHAKPDWCEAYVGGGAFCNVIDVDAKRLRLRAFRNDGSVQDDFAIEK